MDSDLVRDFGEAGLHAHEAPEGLLVRICVVVVVVVVCCFLIGAALVEKVDREDGVTMFPTSLARDGEHGGVGRDCSGDRTRDGVRCYLTACFVDGVREWGSVRRGGNDIVTEAREAGRFGMGRVRLGPRGRNELLTL